MKNENGREKEIINNKIDLYNYSNINKEIYNKKIKKVKYEKYFRKVNVISLVKNIKIIYKNVLFKFLLYNIFFAIFTCEFIRKKKKDKFNVSN